jgi:hypothetical protein
MKMIYVNGVIAVGLLGNLPKIESWRIALKIISSSVRAEERDRS